MQGYGGSIVNSRWKSAPGRRNNTSKSLEAEGDSVSEWRQMWLEHLEKPIPSSNSLKFWKRWEYQTIWPVSWETCMQVKKQQLEPDMEQQTSSK